MIYRFLGSPVGDLLLARDDAGLRMIHFMGRDTTRPCVLKVVPSDWRKRDDAFDDVVAQLTEYFAGERRQFDLTLAPAGTPFQQRVWRALLDIPYGETTSYGELAARIGQRNASRAVGLANGSNPVSIVIPCHRVIGANGKLTGYGGGLPNKERLLALERGERRLL